MNRYGLMAQQHWARWLPARYATIKNPDSFFSDLGIQASDQIDQLALQLAGDDQPGEGYLVVERRSGFRWRGFTAVLKIPLRGGRAGVVWVFWSAAAPGR